MSKVIDINTRGRDYTVRLFSEVDHLTLVIDDATDSYRVPVDTLLAWPLGRPYRLHPDKPEVTIGGLHVAYLQGWLKGLLDRG